MKRVGPSGGDVYPAPRRDPKRPLIPSQLVPSIAVFRDFREKRHFRGFSVGQLETNGQFLTLFPLSFVISIFFLIRGRCFASPQDTTLEMV